jgi:hypothetical protein
VHPGDGDAAAAVREIVVVHRNYLPPAPLEALRSGRRRTNRPRAD